MTPGGGAVTTRRMMAQNRQSDIDRRKAEKDYDINLKAELEIEALHQKIDLMRELEIKRLTDLVEELVHQKITSAAPTDKDPAS